MVSYQCYVCNSNHYESPAEVGVMICGGCGIESCLIPPQLPFNVSYPLIKLWVAKESLTQFVSSPEYHAFLLESKKLGYNPLIYPGEEDELESQSQFPEILSLIMNAYDKYKDKTI